MSTRPAKLGTLLAALTLILALLWTPLPAASGSSAPGGAVVGAIGGEFEEELEEWPEEECEAAEECAAEESERPGREECLVRSAGARVLALRSSDTLRVVIRYRASEPVSAYVSARFSSARGSRSVVLVRRRLSRTGTIRLTERLSPAAMELVRRARAFTVSLDVLGVPAPCRSLLTLRLSKRTSGHGRSVWTEPGG